MSKLLEDARAEAVMWRERCKVAEAQRDEAKAARDTTRATGETAMLTREEFLSHLDSALLHAKDPDDYDEFSYCRNVIESHDAAFRKRDERQREQIVKLRGLLRGVIEASVEGHTHQRIRSIAGKGLAADEKEENR